MSPTTGIWCLFPCVTEISDKVDSPAAEGATKPAAFVVLNRICAVRRKKHTDEFTPMFARAGNDGGDDPYNFDIAGGFRGGGKKKNDGGKSKFAEKASLNKTVGARPSTSSLISQVGSMWHDV